MRYTNILYVSMYVLARELKVDIKILLVVITVNGFHSIVCKVRRD